MFIIRNDIYSVWVYISKKHFCAISFFFFFSLLLLHAHILVHNRCYYTKYAKAKYFCTDTTSSFRIYLKNLTLYKQWPNTFLTEIRFLGFYPVFLEFDSRFRHTYFDPEKSMLPITASYSMLHGNGMNSKFTTAWIQNLKLSSHNV